MKKILSMVLAALFLLSGCGEQKKESGLSENTIYFYYQESCPHCHDAAKYIRSAYPDLKMEKIDVRLPGNMKLFEKSVRQYGVTGPAGTPLIGLGKNYIMGWSPENEKLFDMYVKPFLNKKNEN